jgi:shikimate kinase
MGKKKKIYLIGFMGSGKTSTGKRLSALLGWELIDLDKYVEMVAGKTIPEIFAEEGEVSFRKRESDALCALETKNNCVISTGGGTPCSNDNIEYMLSTGYVVYLKLNPDQLKSRLVNGKIERPLLKGLDEQQLLEFIKNKLESREPFYGKADIIIEGVIRNYRTVATTIVDTMK